MKNGIIIAAVLFFVFSLIAPVFAQNFRRVTPPGSSDFQPGPLLLYPLGREVDLSGADSLEFKWERDAVDTSYFIFRLYKGYGMYESNLILKEEVTSSRISTRVKSDVFENGQVYTWSLVRVVFTGNKTDKSFSSFKVIKK
jgi:hypothetical protein